MEISELVQVKIKKGHGEYAGPCPFCGGNDRFLTWPNDGKTGRFWCRQCHRSGDGLELLRELQGLSFLQAVDAWGLTPEDFPRTGRKRESRTWKPKEPDKDRIPKEWAEQATLFLEECEFQLIKNQEVKEWLKSRGLKPETIRAARLGWNPKDEYHTRILWGLEPATDETGKIKRTYLKAGLVIPHIKDGKIVGLKIRKAIHGTGGKYTHVAGSDASPMVWGLEKKTLVIVESELDGILLNQETGDLVGVVALGSAQARPDAEAHRALKEASLILVALDSDDAGAKEAWQWWTRQYNNVKQWPVVMGKDPSEAFQNGLNLRTWIMAGLPESKPKEPVINTSSGIISDLEPENPIPVNSTGMAIKPDFNHDTTKDTALLENMAIEAIPEPQLMEFHEGQSQIRPYFDADGDPVISADCDRRYIWWHPGGMSLKEIIEELKNERPIRQEDGNGIF